MGVSNNIGRALVLAAQDHPVMKSRGTAQIGLRAYTWACDCAAEFARDAMKQAAKREGKTVYLFEEVKI